MEIAELAWAAGFFDGEGCALIAKRKSPRKHALVLQCDQVHREPLERMKAVLGGGVYGPYGPYGRQEQPAYRWTVYGSKAVHAAEQLLPFLSAPSVDKLKKAGFRAMEIGKPEKEIQIPEQQPWEEPLTIPEWDPAETPIPEPAKSPEQVPEKAPA